MSFFKVLILLFAVSSFTSSFADERCDVKFNTVAVCANIDWVSGPFLDQYNSAKISLSNNTQVSTINVIPWMVMSSHEHGSRPVDLTKTGENEFLIEKAYFMGGMDGQWFLKIQLNDSNHSLIEEVRYLIEFNN
jgi:hypothetical protein